MALVDTADLISISDANKLGVSALIRAAETGHDQVVLRNNKPVAAVVSMQRLDELQRLQEDLLDVSLATARMLTTGPDRYSLDEILARFGYTREQLRDQPDDDAGSR
ncbi:MAG TPA: type II toxin-antitoxin system Phd/YefM family antitoxin [Chloroflexota bacterium]|nr:type II toxin-antitoxin system Phd/YefM family antitoxin [Chloroflexota bacterium]